MPKEKSPIGFQVDLAHIYKICILLKNVNNNRGKINK